MTFETKEVLALPERERARFTAVFSPKGLDPVGWTTMPDGAFCPHYEGRTWADCNLQPTDHACGRCALENAVGPRGCPARFSHWWEKWGYLYKQES